MRGRWGSRKLPLALTRGAAPREGAEVAPQSLRRQQQSEWEEAELQGSLALSLVAGRARRRRGMRSWKTDLLRAGQHKNTGSGSGDPLAANCPEDRLQQQAVDCI